MMKSRTKIYTLFMIITVLLSAAASYGASQDNNPGNAAEKVSSIVQNYFIPLNGIITEAESGQMKVKFDTETAINKGMRFPAFREGAPFYHPVTNELMGKTEDYTGSLEIKGKDNSDGTYFFNSIDGDLKAGDIVRMTSSRIKLAFFQDPKSDWALSELFYSSLKKSGRFDILEAYTSDYDLKALAVTARELGAEAVLLFNTPEKDSGRFLHVKLFWAKDAEIFGDIEKLAGTEVIESLKTEKDFISASLTDKEPWGSYALENGLLIAVGDIDGDREKEYVISDGTNLRIYKLKDELQEVWFLKGGKSEKHISIDILDLNNNGYAEIFVTSMGEPNSLANTLQDSMVNPLKEAGSINSYVIEYGPSNGYQKIADNIPYFMRVADNKLLMQTYAPAKAFSGPVYEGSWKGGKYQPGKALTLPSDVNIYGFTFVRWAENSPVNLISFDDRGYLILYDANGNNLWKSSKSYGKFEFEFERKTYSIANPIKKWAVRGRLIPVNTERGQEVIAVNRIPIVSMVPGLGVTGAEVNSLFWDGAAMDEKLILNEVSGSITDFWVEGRNLFLVAKGGLLSFVKNAVSGELSKGSVLYYYNFGEK